MPEYGAIRCDFTPQQGRTLSLGEDWPLRFPVEDENGLLLSSFSGLTSWGFAILDRLDTANGWTAVQAAALHQETGTITASVPNVDLTVTAAEQTTATLTVRDYAYELWQLNTPVRRVAYGTLRPIA
jgi:hypothetical protein